MQGHILRVVYPIAGVALIIVAWHYYVILFDVPRVVQPEPMKVATAMVAEGSVVARRGLGHFS